MSVIAEGQLKLEKTPSFDTDTIDQASTHSSSSSSHQNSAKKDKIKVVKESLSNIEDSLIDLCDSTKILKNVPENLLDTEKPKNNKEIEMLNINSDDMSIEKSMQPNVTLSCIKSLASSFMNKSSSLFITENETESTKKELSERRRPRESTEITIKHNLSKEVADNLQEKMDISMESLNSITTSETVLLQHDNTELVDKIINTELVDKITKNETSIENISICSNEDATEVINESDKIDKKECTVIDNKNSNKIESDKVDITSRPSISLAKSTQIENTDGNRESFTSILTTGDDNDDEIKLTLEERSLCQDENEVSSNITYSELDQSVDLQILSPINESSDVRTIVIQNKVIDSSDSIEEIQENLSKRGMEPTPSSTILETNNVTHVDSNNGLIQEDQSSDIIETSKNFAMDISPEKTAAKDILSKKIMRRSLKQKNTDVDGSLEMEINQEKDQENIEIDDVPDVDGIDLVQDIPADKWKEKNDVKIDSMQSISQSVEEVENDNEDECDLILVDKRAWLAAEMIKAAKEAESFEDDSNDTVLLKSQLDATQTNYNTKKLDSVDEELLIDINSKEDEKRIKKRKSRTKRFASEIDSSRYTDDEDNLAPADKSFNESKTALNPTDQFMSRLNKSEQLTRTKGRFSKASDESDKDIEDDDVNKLNRSSLINKKDIFLRKSMERRISLNKSSKDSSMRNVSANKSLQIDDSEEELNTDAHIGTKLYKKKRSLNKSHNEDADDNAIESEIKNVSTKDSNEKDKNASLNRSVDQESKSITKIMIYLSNDDESDDSYINITPMDFGSKTSMIANAGSDSGNQDERDIPSYLFAKSNNDNDSDDSSSDSDDSNSDINREYNLDGVEKSKFSDDDVPADECRTSEVEFSDSDDNGSDLADFIVDDDDVENEEEDDDVENEEEDDDEDMYNMRKDDESENEQNVEENDEDEENKQAHINTELINTEDENEKDNEDIQEKDYTADREEDAKENKFEMEAISSYANISNKLSHKSKNKSTEYISPRKSDTEMKQDIKIKKSSVKKNEKTTLLDSSNSDLSIKKKKKKSLENKIQFSSTPNRNSYKKLEFDERISENKDIKSDDTIKATQNILVKKEKSKKDSILNKDIDLKKFSNANEEKVLNSDFSPDLLKLLEKTNISKSFKTELHKTMNIIDTETPTIKHLRKEKLNESVPTLKLNSETSSLPTKKLSTEKKDTAQIKVKEKNNRDKVSDLVMLSNDDVIQKRNQKKQKKKRDTLKKNSIDETLSEDAIELNIPKKKKPVKLTQLTIVDDNIHKDACQVNEKKKKKKQGTSKKNITDKALSEDAVELKIPKKKKLVKHTQLTIINDNIHEDACQISEKKKKKKKQDTSRENIIDEALSEDTMELKIPKKKKFDKFTQLTVIDDNIHKDALISEKKEKKKKKKKKQETSEENIIDEALYKDVVELKIPKKKKCTKFIQSSIVEDNIYEDMCQINEKEKQKKKQKTLKESIAEKALFEDVAELKVPKKKKHVQLSELVIMDDNTCKNVYHIAEKKKKKKKENITEKALSENEIESKIPKKKKYANFNQLASIQDTREDFYQLNEKEKKKNKKQININENVNEDNIFRKNICENKTELAQRKKKNKITHSLKLDLPIDEPIIKKKKQQETVENIETLRTENKKNALPVQIPVLKLKSNKNLLSHKSLRKTALDASESRNVIYTKKLDEVTANMCIPKELKPKKKRDQTEDIENVNIPNKRSKKEVKEMTKFLPSSSGVKRLSDNVIENLADVPRVKKRRKVSQNEEQVVPSMKNKSKRITADCDNSFTLNTSDCTTQFHVVNLQNTKKQSSKGAAAAASFRQRMLAKNKREPISAYMMYHDKMNFIK